MTIMCQQADGTFVPDPDYYPTDLITVRSVYGRKYRVRGAHLEDPTRILLPVFNQRGRRLVETPENFGKRYLHRDNIAEGANPPLFAGRSW